MSNSLYDAGRAGFLAGSIDWDANDIKMDFIDEADDTPNLTTDDFHDDRADAAIVDTTGNFANKTTTAGVADADDITVTTVTGDQFESLDIYQDTGNEATSLYICNIDTATGLACTPNGGDIEIVFSSAAEKIFKL